MVVNSFSKQCCDCADVFSLHFPRRFSSKYRNFDWKMFEGQSFRYVHSQTARSPAASTSSSRSFRLRKRDFIRLWSVSALLHRVSRIYYRRADTGRSCRRYTLVPNLARILFIFTRESMAIRCQVRKKTDESSRGKKRRGKKRGKRDERCKK